MGILSDLGPELYIFPLSKHRAKIITVVEVVVPFHIAAVLADNY